MLKLRCGAQQYAWGKKGADSQVAHLLKTGGHADSVDASKPYAELWMGVHPNCPSRVKGIEGESEKLLSDILKEKPHLLGTHEQGTLQFLFKVLSVQQALSIQAHPTKDQAKVLHAADPKNYPDDNHKPEMAIALSNFELLCGFRPAAEIAKNIQNYPSVLAIVGKDAVEGLTREGASDEDKQQTLRTIFTNLWHLTQERITNEVHTLISFIEHKKENKVEPTALEQLLVRLDKEYPGGDVGVFAPLFLNYFTLRPGQATFLGPNRPHAYLKGDCMECMACSDNTIRAGLTPKYKDVNTLCTNLDYTMSEPPILMRCPSTGDTYAPATPEFALQQITDATNGFSSVAASSLLIVVNGDATLTDTKSGQVLTVHTGEVVFVPAGTEKVALSQPTSFFQAWRAYTPLL